MLARMLIIAVEYDAADDGGPSGAEQERKETTRYSYLACLRFGDMNLASGEHFYPKHVTDECRTPVLSHACSE